MGTKPALSLAYQIRLSLTAFGSENDARGYLENLQSFWQAGVGTESAHEEPLAGVTPLKLIGPLGPDALGLTLEFRDAGAGRSYYQTYVAFTESNVRGSFSLFTPGPPSAQVRDQAEALAASLQEALRQTSTQ